MVEKQFKALSMRETESHRKEITKEIVKKAIKMMRNKRAPDRRGWRAEWLKNGGEEIENSLVKLFNRMERENTIPLQSQWEEAEANRIIKDHTTVEGKNRLYGLKIWEIKRKVTRATETPHSVKRCISDTLPKSLKNQSCKNGIGKDN